MKLVLYRDCFGITTNQHTSSIKLFAYLLISTLQSHAGWAQHPCGTVGRFPCGDGACISVAKVCNGVRDCRRGVDEIDCGARRTCRRDVFIANSNRYACRKSCTTDVDCRGARKRCVCDNECGKSCIYPGKICLDEPPVVEHGRSIVKRVIRGKLRPTTGSYRYSDVATYECDVGYKLLGPRPRCTARGIWSDEAPVCVDITCRAVPIIRHAVDYRILRTQSGLTLEHLHTYTSPMVGDEIVYLCEDGYRLVGTLPVCTPELQFTEFTAKCVVLCYHERNADLIRKYGLHCGQACNSSSDCPQGDECICVDPCGRNCANTNADCPAAPDVPNASMTYEGAGLGKTARYRCHNGFYLESGRLSLHCSSSGTWLEQPPVCLPVACGRPYSSIQATRGYAIGNYRSFGSNVTFECTGNRRLVGSRTRQCLGDGVWSGFLAVCIDPDEEVDCHHPGVPINGRLIGSDFSVGASVRFECDEHYLMYGWPEQVCTEYRRWSGNGAPLCKYFKYPVSEPESVGILTSAISQMPAQNYRQFGRTIDVNDDAQMHEIFFVIDVSKSIVKYDLKEEIDFAVALVKKMKFFRKYLKYAIMIFATKPKMLLSLQSDDSPKSDFVIDKLSSLLNEDIGGNRGIVKGGTGTTAALQSLKREISLARRQSRNTVKTHIFMFTDGNHTTGPDPVAERQNIQSEFDPTVEFYSITACDKCDAKALKELKGLASVGSNFIRINDYHLLDDYLKKVTNVQIDYSICGSAGRIGDASKVTSLGRTFGGKDATPYAWPWQAAIVEDFTSKHDNWTLTAGDVIGGGSVINEQWILTAAHVLHEKDSETCSIFVGLFEKHNLHIKDLPNPIQRLRIESNISHPMYNHTTKNNDIALIKVKGKITLNEFVRPICLPCTGTCLTPKILELSRNDDPNLERCRREENVLLRAGEKTAVTGYGDHSHENKKNYVDVELPVLRQVVLQIANDSTCRKRVKEIQRNIYNDNNICTEPTLDDKPVDACKGDSGGPMIREVYDATTRRSCWVQIGIVSFGKGCGTGDYPGYFTNVLKYVEWVNVTMGNSLSGP